MAQLTRYGPYKGEYFTIFQLKEITGLSVATLRSRMHRGWSISQIIETPIIKAGTYLPDVESVRKKHVYNGKRYTIEQLTKMPECSVSAFTLRTRLENGWDIHRAMETPLLREKTPPKAPAPKNTIMIYFERPIDTVNRDMQPRLNTPYMAEVGLGNTPTRETNYFIITLDNGKPLIVYEREFQKVV